MSNGRGSLHILMIALCAVVCGADDFVAMEEWGHAKQDWLQERLELAAEGIPSHDTFGRVFTNWTPSPIDMVSAWACQSGGATAGDPVFRSPEIVGAGQVGMML